MIRIQDAASPKSIQIVHELLQEYGALLDVSMGREELAALPGEYSSPFGALLVARNGRAGPGRDASRCEGLKTGHAR